MKNSGALPPGLLLSQDTGIMTGTPTSAGDYTFELKVTDANGVSSKKTFTISVVEASSSINAQLFGQTNAVVSSFSALQTAGISGTPAGINPSSAAQMNINNLTPGETVSVAVSFVSIASID